MKAARSFSLLLFLTFSSAQIPGGVPLLNQGQDRFRQAIQLERIGELEAVSESFSGTSRAMLNLGSCSS